MPDQKPLTKTEILSALAESSELTKQQVTSVLDGLSSLIAKNLGDSGPGVFTIPGLMKLTVAVKPATPEREGINPFTKEPTVFKAKPASKSVKIRPLKTLKDMV
ncbi:MAG: nucleoid DNA-binding protein [Pirellulaceae bacterium]|jgi:nucleoid DNA-binding protein